MIPPHDGDDVAPVIPLRQRQGSALASPTKREPLPRERAAFDPELEGAEVMLRRPIRRRIGSRFSTILSSLRIPQLPARSLVVALVMSVAVLAILSLIVLPSLGGRFARRPAARLASHRHSTLLTQSGTSPGLQHRTSVARRATNRRRQVAQHHRRVRSGSKQARHINRGRHATQPAGVTSPPAFQPASSTSSTGTAQSAGGSATTPQQTSTAGPTNGGPLGGLGSCVKGC